MKATRSRSSALALLLLAGGCRQILGIDEGEVAKDAVVADVAVDDAPIDTPPCGDKDADGVCNDVDKWPCGEEPADLPGVVTWEVVQKGDAATIQLTNPVLEDSRKLVVSAGAPVRLKTQYSIVDCVCPACIDQIEIGFVPTVGRVGCIYNGNPNGMNSCLVPTTGSVERDLVAPTTPGAYTLRFRMGQDLQCNTQTTWWDNTEPPASATAVHLCVTPP